MHYGLMLGQRIGKGRFAPTYFVKEMMHPISVCSPI